MNKQNLAKTSRLLIAIVLCSIVVSGLFFYIQLYQEEASSQKDLFTLVPQNTIGIIETNNINHYFYQLEQTDYYNASKQLHFSAILDFLNQKIDGIAKKKAHGLSSSMSNILISFHQPNGLYDQVLYGHLGNGDKNMMEHILQEISNAGIPKKETYKGEPIIIYPISNTEYLSCYFKSNYYAISFQKKLIEQVIDCQKSHMIVRKDSLFASIYEEKKYENGIRLYIHSNSEWTRYDLQLNHNSIYLTGHYVGNHNGKTFINSLTNSCKKPLIAPEILPDHTTTFIQMGVNNIHELANLLIPNDSTQQREELSAKSQTDTMLYDFLDNYSQNEIDYIEFQGDEPFLLHRVLLIPMKFNLKTIMNEWEKFTSPILHTERQGHQSYPIYCLNSNDLMQYLLFKNSEQPKELMAIIRDDYMLISDSKEDLKAYLSLTTHALKEAYYTTVLANEANFTLFSDMEEIYQRPDEFKDLIPPFLIQYADFFRQYTITLQYIESVEPMNTNIILSFKGDFVLPNT